MKKHGGTSLCINIGDFRSTMNVVGVLTIMVLIFVIHYMRNTLHQVHAEYITWNTLPEIYYLQHMRNTLPSVHVQYITSNTYGIHYLEYMCNTLPSVHVQYITFSTCAIHYLQYMWNSLKQLDQFSEAIVWHTTLFSKMMVVCRNKPENIKIIIVMLNNYLSC